MTAVIGPLANIRHHICNIVLKSRMAGPSAFNIKEGAMQEPAVDRGPTKTTVPSEKGPEAGKFLTADRTNNGYKILLCQKKTHNMA